MNPLIEAQKKLLPDMLEVMQKRYTILQAIRLLQPIGRRGLANYIEMSERILRGEVTFLRDQSLLTIQTSGMQLTELGNQLLVDLDEIMKDVQGLTVLEEKLKKVLNAREVILVAGDSDKDELSKRELARACATKMGKHFHNENIIAVSGGTTLAEVADKMSPLSKGQKALFVPARGGIGENVKNQANSICAAMAEKTNGEYRLLHVPDNVSAETYESIIQDNVIEEVLNTIRSSTMVVHGIGDAITMAKRRKTSTETMEKIKEAKASGEAFGYYFNQQGEVVWKVNTVGLQLENVKNAPCVIAVAGGSSKAKAIAAYMKQAANTILVTDEGAATSLLADISSE